MSLNSRAGLIDLNSVANGSRSISYGEGKSTGGLTTKDYTEVGRRHLVFGAPEMDTVGSDQARRTPELGGGYSLVQMSDEHASSEEVCFRQSVETPFQCGESVFALWQLYTIRGR